jgi:hypothetical protein
MNTMRNIDDRLKSQYSTKEIIPINENVSNKDTINRNHNTIGI